MPYRKRLVGLVVLFLLATLAETAQAERLRRRTALDRYVARKDNSYSWKVVSRKKNEGLTILVVDMVSQTWRTAKEVDRPVWQHWLTVAVPDEVKSDTGLLWIGGGRNGSDPPTGTSAIVETMARATGTIVAELRMVPNQSLEFHGDGQKRSEDDLVAYTWVQYLKTGDATWPARNPMVKSAVRAMDTLTSLSASDDGSGVTVNTFVVAGGSKRGWTTWLTGAVDKRVVAVIPIVIDVLNVKKFNAHHFGTYGFWAPAIGNYVEHGITEQEDHSRIQSLYELVDPYYYRHRLTMPKFMVNAAGDQFFLPDSSQFYFDELPGQKNLRYVPNADHSLNGSDAIESMLAFYSLVLADRPTPDFSWTHGENGRLTVKSGEKPAEVRLWQANNPNARDFRMETLGPQYSSKSVELNSDGQYEVTVPEPEKGWTAYFIELTYDVGGPAPLKLTTNVRVTPDVLPYKDKDSQLPATITIQATAPDQATVEKLQAALKAPQLATVAKAVQLFSGPTATAPSPQSVRVNWKPVGRFRDSAGAIAKLLTDLGYQEFHFWYESGPRRE